jgi:DNA-binding transcriptional regulator YiaG
VLRQIGVNKDTIHNWETNRTESEVRLIPHMIDFLGYDPHSSFGQWLVAIRATLGLPQRQFARKIGVDATTIAKWETGKHKPTRKKLMPGNNLSAL